MERKTEQPWLHSAMLDGVFMLSPPFIALALVAFLPSIFQSSGEIPLIYWLVLVVFIDVAHVYSTLYRTYFRSSEFKGFLLTVVPLGCYVSGVILHSLNGMLFWRCLAYLAIFHFVRQQYGFMRLYSRHERSRPWERLTDTVAIYTATLYPLLYWHFEGGRAFSWFIEDDVLSFPAPHIAAISLVLYFVVILVYVIKELAAIVRTGRFNWPRNLLVAGTFLSWYFGIVFFNGDMAFTTLNVISHGIPYMALIWVMEAKKNRSEPAGKRLFLDITFRHAWGLVFFVLLLALLAYLEEGLWDGLVWKEHGSVFKSFSGLPQIDDHLLLSLVVPLLALPQATHYVLDGFIWKIKKSSVQ